MRCEWHSKCRSNGIYLEETVTGEYYHVVDTLLTKLPEQKEPDIVKQNV